MTHARRWARAGDKWAVQNGDGKLLAIRKPWGTVVEDAALGWEPTPHTLKHTAITRVYWHLSPHFQKGAVAAIEGRMGR